MRLLHDRQEPVELDSDVCSNKQNQGGQIAQRYLEDVLSFFVLSTSSRYLVHSLGSPGREIYPTAGDSLAEFAPPPAGQASYT